MSYNPTRLLNSIFLSDLGVRIEITDLLTYDKDIASRPYIVELGRQYKRMLKKILKLAKNLRGDKYVYTR